MRYFSNLPGITQSDFNGNQITVNNILSRNYFLPSLKSNILYYYEYDINEGDTPEIIAHKYYNDVYRYWMVMYPNDIYDIGSNWPLSDNQFSNFIFDKYKTDAADYYNIPVSQINFQQVLYYTSNTQIAVHHYEKIITVNSTEYNESQDQITTVEIDETTYNNLIPTTNQAVFPNGSIVTRKVAKNAVSLYDYEISVNESKRKIQLLRDVYATDVEERFQELMST